MSSSLTTTTSWKLLLDHYEKIKDLHLRTLFQNDDTRGQRLLLKTEDIYFDFSKHRITDETLELLFQLAEERGLEDKRSAMFSGENINTTENRAVLHTALRAPKGSTLIFDGYNVVPDVHAVLDKMSDFSNKIRKGEWRGYTGKPIKNVVNLVLEDLTSAL